MLKKTSIYLDEELDQGLARKAAEEGITKAELIRRSLDAVVHRPKRPKPKAIGLIKGGPSDLGRNAEHYLEGVGEA
jgi:Ribbon-helix-helix protein, copG family